MELLIVLGLILWVIPRVARRAAQTTATTQDGDMRSARPAQPRAMLQRLPTQLAKPPQPAKPLQPARPPAEELCPIETEMHARPEQFAWGGSMLATTPGYETVVEGYGDHRERPSQRAVDAYDMQPVEIPGINLTFEKDSLIAGVVFSEILARRPARRQH